MTVRGGVADILQALLDRESSGVGANLDIAQFECNVSPVGPLLLAAMLGTALPPRMENRSETAALRRVDPGLVRHVLESASSEVPIQPADVGQVLGRCAIRRMAGPVDTAQVGLWGPRVATAGQPRYTSFPFSPPGLINLTAFSHGEAPRKRPHAFWKPWKGQSSNWSKCPTWVRSKR